MDGLDTNGTACYDAFMTTTTKITRLATDVELTSRELVLVQAAMFDALVRVLKDSRAFDITNPDDDDALMDCRIEADIIRTVQRKIDSALNRVNRKS